MCVYVYVFILGGGESYRSCHILSDFVTHRKTNELSTFRSPSPGRQCMYVPVHEAKSKARGQLLNNYRGRLSDYFCGKFSITCLGSVAPPFGLTAN